MTKSKVSWVFGVATILLGTLLAGAVLAADPVLPLTAGNTNVRVFLLDAPCTDANVQALLTAAGIAHVMPELKAAVYVDSGVRSEGCFQFARKDSAVGPVVGVAVIWDDGTSGLIRLDEFEPVDLKDVPGFDAKKGAV